MLRGKEGSKMTERQKEAWSGVLLAALGATRLIRESEAVRWACVWGAGNPKRPLTIPRHILLVGTIVSIDISKIISIIP